MKEFCKKYQHFLLVLYGPFYVGAFRFLETIRPETIHELDIPFDHWVPFIEVFVVPYLLWFAFMGVAGIYFLFREKESFIRMMYFGIFGMTIFLIISWVYPNGLDLRPEVFPRENVFVDLVRRLYAADTATNVLPSIHVFNSVGVCCAVHESESLKKHPFMQKASTVLAVLIILSTMFIKQHSVVDVISGLLLSYIAWELFYNQGVERLSQALYAAFRNAQRLRYRKKKVPRWQSK